jgi:hypothetical protein
MFQLKDLFWVAIGSKNIQVFYKMIPLSLTEIPISE